MNTQDQITAQFEISQVLYRYCRAVDRGDVELLKSVYHKGAIDSHGAWSGSGEAFAERLVASMDEVGLPSMHHITNILVELQNDTARVESYFLAQHPYQEDGINRIANVGGRYLDHFSYRNGAWKISERTVVLDWTRADIAGSDWSRQVDFPTGARGTTDPSRNFFVGPSEPESSG